MPSLAKFFRFDLALVGFDNLIWPRQTTNCDEPQKLSQWKLLAILAPTFDFHLMSTKRPEKKITFAKLSIKYDDDVVVV